MFKDPVSPDRSSEAVGSRWVSVLPNTAGTSSGITSFSLSRRDNNYFKFGPKDLWSLLIQSHVTTRSSTILPIFPSGGPVLASQFIFTNVHEPIPPLNPALWLQQRLRPEDYWSSHRLGSGWVIELKLFCYKRHGYNHVISFPVVALSAYPQHQQYSHEENLEC